MTDNRMMGGDVAPPSLCFIGGWGSTGEVWRGTLDCEALDRRALDCETLDRPPLRFEAQFLNWLECLRDWPGALASICAPPGRCVLVGWSLGSLLALRAVLDIGETLPEKIAAMVLVSATPRMCAGEDYAGVDPRMLAAMRARIGKSPDAVLEEFAEQCAAPDGSDQTRASWLRQAKQFSAEEMAAGLECLASLDVRERLGEIGLPCRILHGDGDGIVPLGSAQFLARRIAGAELEVLPGRGHALPFTAPAEIARCTANFIGASVLR
jgi:pimeloyl-[acyl-carrier protein] methyl ester esterase